MKTLSYLIFLAISPTLIVADDQEIVWEIPFKEAKVNHHRSKICITNRGVTNCVGKLREPGSPTEIAKLFRIYNKVEPVTSIDEDDNEKYGHKNRLNKKGKPIEGEGNMKEVIPKKIAHKMNWKNKPAALQYDADNKQYVNSNEQSGNAEEYKRVADRRQDDMLRTIDFMEQNKKWLGRRRMNINV